MAIVTPDAQDARTDRATDGEIRVWHRWAILVLALFLLAEFAVLILVREEPFPNYFGPPFIRLDDVEPDRFTRSTVAVTVDGERGGLELLLPDQQVERLATLDALLIKRLHEADTLAWLRAEADAGCHERIFIEVTDTEVFLDGVEEGHSAVVDELLVEGAGCGSEP